MEGEPLDYVKRAACYVVDLLDQNDILSIVVFAEDVQTVMPARRVVNKQLVKEHIMRLTVGNTTNIFDGIMMAGQQVAAANSPGVASRVLLLTDGDPTAGIKDYNSIVSKAAEFKQSGISMTTLGFGLEYNEELIAGIARRCGGNYYYISRPDLIPEVFRRELDQLMTVTAQNLRLKITLSKWVRMRQVYNAAPSFSGNSVIVSLVDMERGTQMSTLAELEFGPRPTGTYRVAQAEIAYDDLGTGAPNVARCDVVLEFTNDEVRLQAPDDPRVLQEIQLAEATRSLQKTMMGMRTQQLGSTDATMQLQAARTMMLQQGRHKEAAELEKTIMELQAGTGAAEKTLMGAIVSLESGKQG
jgi:Ca-activated chloride channel family protein